MQNIKATLAFNAILRNLTTLLECKLYLMQKLYDLGNVPSSANQCILGNGYDMRCKSGSHRIHTTKKIRQP